MKSRLLICLILLGCLGGLTHWAARAMEPAGPMGIQTRVPWTTSRVQGTPEPPPPYVAERVFPELTIEKCLDLAPLPGSDRLFVLTRPGKLYSFHPAPDVDEADLVADLAQEIPGVRNTYAIVFHPDFAANRYCYICCVEKGGEEDGSRIIRFQVRDTEPPTLDIDSRTTIISWPAGGHNGCCLRFGPDGCLYISTGDGVGPNPPDTKQAGQDVTNLLSCILRIDVDHSEDGRNYRIPDDNPFADHPDARGEIWAYGFRNPWRMSFDRETGDLWVGDVGWELWELLDRVEKGGNYGWSVMEGRQPTNVEFPRGPTPILPPTIDHPHSESSSITDGLTYYGDRLRELHGAHIYGDYDTGKIWAFRWTEDGVAEHREIADTTNRIASFGELPDGEFLLVDHVAGGFFRLRENPRRGEPPTFPRRLSKSGLFESVADHTPAAGVIPYSLNAELWSDHAHVERWIAVPGDSSITVDESDWDYPAGAVLVRTLSLAMQAGDPASRRRVETQLLHYDGIDWRPYTFRWNEEQTDASLVPAEGAEQTLSVSDPDAPEGVRLQTWRFAARAQCQRCHNPWSGPPIGFQTALLNKSHRYGGPGSPPVSQLETLSHIGILQNLPAAEQRTRLANPHDEQADLQARARAYLHVNCAHCHRKHGGGAVLSEMQHDIQLAKARLIGQRPSQGGFGIYGAQVVAPGDPCRSVLMYRMSKSGGGRMPHLGSTLTDADGVRLIRRWIASLPDQPAEEADEQVEAAVRKIRQQQRQALDQLLSLTSGKENTERQAALIDQLLSSTSGALLLLEAVDTDQLDEAASQQAVQAAATHGDIRIRDLFERFLPPSQRVQRLGAVVDPEEILSLEGDPRRGEEVFVSDVNGCKRCHRVAGQGGEVGPDLSTIAKKLDARKLLESILQPSKQVEPKFVTYRVETSDGRLLTGLLEEKNQEHVVLRDAKNNRQRISAAEIERIAPSRVSLMPELLLQNMTARQAADLLAYLRTLRDSPKPN